MIGKLEQFLLSFRQFAHPGTIAKTAISYSRWVKTAYGPTIRSRVNDWTNWAAITGSYGSFIADHIATFPRESIFIDIGANLGLFSLLASKKLSNGYVFAFEPNLIVFRDLLENVEHSGARNIFPLNIAIGDCTEIGHIQFTDNHTGGGVIKADKSGQAVVVMTIENLLPIFEANGQRNIYCKIDTEGFELKVLKSLERSELLPSLTGVLVEINDELLTNFDASSKEIYQLMANNGFLHEVGHDPNVHYDEYFFRPS